jgi:hypothetical protein
VKALRGPFRFDAQTHTYTVGGVAVPGIHAVLRAGGIEKDLSFLNDYYLQRGRAVHEATMKLDLGSPLAMVENGLSEEWHPFLHAYVQFRSDVTCRWTKVEQPVVHRTLRYATIVDRVGRVSGRPAVFEVKTGYPAEFHGPQLAGADILVAGRVHIGLRRRMAVYLTGDGTYKLKEYIDPADYSRFMQAIEQFWREDAEPDGDRLDSYGDGWD